MLYNDSTHEIHFLAFFSGTYSDSTDIINGLWPSIATNTGNT
jgi:hypothetical protein